MDDYLGEYQTHGYMLNEINWIYITFLINYNSYCERKTFVVLLGDCSHALFSRSCELMCQGGSTIHIEHSM